MGSIRRGLALFISLALFSFTFFIGFGTGRSARAAGDDAENTDSAATLPPDVQERLNHLTPATGAADFGPAVTFWEVLGKVKTLYVDRVTDQDRLTHGAVAQMLKALHDPYSRILTPDELSLDRQEAEGLYNGVGVVLGARLSGAQAPVKPGATTTPTPVPSGPQMRQPDAPDRVWQLTVVDTVPGGAAQRAGLQTGDVISKINGVRIDARPLAQKTIDDINLMLNGPTVKSATISVLRPSTNTTLDFRMDGGGPVRFSGLEAHLLPGGAVYARVPLFAESAANELARSLGSLTGSHPSTLELDLRDNPGGSLEAAEGVIGMLAGNGPAGLLEARSGAEKLAAILSPQASTLPRFDHITVLVNGGTAQAAELVAAALQQRKSAILAGSPTFGNGLVQTLYPLKGGWAYAMTTGLIRGPDGINFNGHGLQVDRSVPPDQLNGDAALATLALSAPSTGEPHL